MILFLTAVAVVLFLIVLVRLSRLGGAGPLAGRGAMLERMLRGEMARMREELQAVGPACSRRCSGI